MAILAAAPAATAQLQPSSPGYATWLYANTRASVLNVILQATEFSQSRAAGDEMAMQMNAAELLSALVEAREWSAALDNAITADAFTPEIDGAVTDLATQMEEANVRLVSILLAADLDAIGDALDDAGPAFNRLSLNLTRLRPMMVDRL